MDSSEIFETWAPTGGPWSPWAKPVLFAHITGPAKGSAVAGPDERLELAAAPLPGTAFVVDLPGPESIEAALELARLGFRPVPLFNGCPDPDFLGKPDDEAVPTAPLLAALIDGADPLKTAGLPLDAPPPSCWTPIGSGRDDGSCPTCSTTAGSCSRPTSPPLGCWPGGGSRMSRSCMTGVSRMTWSTCSGDGSGAGSSCLTST